MKNAAVRQLKMPEARRPQASEIHEQKKRPRIAETLTQMTSLEASGGVMFRTIASSVTCHNASATPPVCVSPVKQPARFLEAATARQPVRRFRHEGPDIEPQQGRQKDDRK